MDKNPLGISKNVIKLKELPKFKFEFGLVYLEKYVLTQI